MSAPRLQWATAGIGHLNIDWASLTHQRFDPYLFWFDTMAQGMEINIVVELVEPIKDNDPAIKALADSDWLVAPFYKKHLGSYYLTASALKPDALSKLQEMLNKPNQTLLKRYELSVGFRNPDFRSDDPEAAISSIADVNNNFIGFVDYGCPFLHGQLRDEKGNSRVRVLWDQSIDDDVGPWTKQKAFQRGRTATRSSLSKFAAAFKDEETCYRASGYEAIQRFATHGAHMMDVATGFPSPLAHPLNRGLQSSAPIVFVQLPRFTGQTQVSGLLRAHVLDALNFTAAHLKDGKRAVINLSYGSNCGPHDGSSILEQAMDELLARHLVDGKDEQRLHLVVPSGNALDTSTHAQLLVGSSQTGSLGWRNVPDDPSDSFVELWVDDACAIKVRVHSPGGLVSPWVGADEAIQLEDAGNRSVACLISARRPCQSDRGSMVLLAVGPTVASKDRALAPYGEWRIEIQNAAASSTAVNAWCERDDPVFGNEAGPRQSQFTDHIEKTGTLNSIAHGRRTIVVGGYDLHTAGASIEEGPISRMSATGPGRGLSGRDRHPSVPGTAAKRGPEVLAPCSLGFGDEGIAAAAVLAGDQVRLTGTSVAAAAVTRYVVEAGFVAAEPPAEEPNPPCSKPKPPPPIPGREPHPDDNLDIPRLPKPIDGN
jgi:hypothetical protein